MPIPTSIPFLESAYAQRPRHPDTGSQSFFRAYERAQQERIEAPLRALQLKVAQQNLDKAQIELAEKIRTRDDAIAARGALTVFADRIRRAKVLGLDQPAGLKSVTDWLEGNRGLLLLPEGKDLWEDLLKSIEDDRRNKAQLEELRVRNESQLAVQSAMAERQVEVEGVRVAGRRTLEEFKAERREDLERLRVSLHISESGKVVTPSEFVNRHLNATLQLLPVTRDPAQSRQNISTATQWLLDTYNDKLADLQKTAPVQPQAPPSASTYATTEDVVAAYKAGRITRAEASRILTEQFGIR